MLRRVVVAIRHPAQVSLACVDVGHKVGCDVDRVSVGEEGGVFHIVGGEDAKGWAPGPPGLVRVSVDSIAGH